MDIDELMNKFRLASREIFNHYFKVLNPYEYESDAWLFEERFLEVEKILFKKMIAEPTSTGGEKYGDVQPMIRVQLRDVDFAPIMLNREIDSGYWDHDVKEVTKEASLIFLSFFDWDKLDFRDNQYVRVQVSDWPLHPDVIGKHALIEMKNVRFFSIRGT